MKKVRVFAAAAILCVVPPAGGIAQPYGDAVGLYNPDNVVTLSGTVIMISQSVIGVDSGIEIMLRTNTEGNMPVVIVPYSGSNGFNIQLNDPGVVVTGSKIFLNGRTVILAAEVINGNLILQLRDTGSGRPLY